MHEYIVKHIFEIQKIRWLDGVFQGQYLPRLSTTELRRQEQRFGTIITTAVLHGDENCFDRVYNDIGVSGQSG